MSGVGEEAAGFDDRPYFSERFEFVSFVKGVVDDLIFFKVYGTILAGFEFFAKPFYGFPGEKFAGGGTVTEKDPGVGLGDDGFYTRGS